MERDRRRVEAALQIVGLRDFADSYPATLSGGMAQRASLARALVNRPRLFLMDEPLGKLDALTRLQLQDEILKLWESQRFTAVLVTHDVDEALRLSNRVVVLSERLRASSPTSRCPSTTSRVTRSVSCVERSSACWAGEWDTRRTSPVIRLVEAQNTAILP